MALVGQPGHKTRRAMIIATRPASMKSRRGGAAQERQRHQEQHRVVGQDHRDRGAEQLEQRTDREDDRLRERGCALAPARAACRRAAPLPAGRAAEMIAIDTPASTANRMLDRPLTTSLHVDGSSQSKRPLHADVGAEHAEHGEPARDVDPDDPGGRAVARRRAAADHRIIPAPAARPAAPSGRAGGSPPRPR